MRAVYVYVMCFYLSHLHIIPQTQREVICWTWLCVLLAWLTGTCDIKHCSSQRVLPSNTS